MAKNKHYSTKRRKINRTSYYLGANGSTADTTVLTATQAVTLIRSRMRVKINAESVSGAEKIMNWELMIKRKGTALPTFDANGEPAYGNTLEFLMADRESVMRETTGADGSYQFLIDNKGQRELEIGDALVFRFDGDAFVNFNLCSASI